MQTATYGASTGQGSRPRDVSAVYAKASSAQFITMSQAMQSIRCHSLLTRSFLSHVFVRPDMKAESMQPMIGTIFKLLIGFATAGSPTICRLTRFDAKKN